MFQFINRYNEVKDICNDQLLWGDEIEYTVIALDHDNRKARISLRAAEVRARERPASMPAPAVRYSPSATSRPLLATHRPPLTARLPLPATHLRRASPRRTCRSRSATT